jgi:uncharacterized protein YceK
VIRKEVFVAMVAVTLVSGCASIVNGQNQSLSVQTQKAGKQVAGASCKLSNPDGVWFVTTPGSTTVDRSFENLVIQCDKEGFGPGLNSVKSSTKAMAFGNIIFGGVIGAGVDMASGAAYDYPELITIEMGDAVILEPVVKLESIPVSVPAASSALTPSDTISQ